MLIRIANMDDIEQLRHLYSELEIDAVKYQPEHFVVSIATMTFLTQYLKVVIRILSLQKLMEQ